jgi:hypothetical protein
MNLQNRDLVTIDDLSNGEIESIFSLADEMSAAMPQQYGICNGKVMATIFFEPSTRTRLSFEAVLLVSLTLNRHPSLRARASLIWQELSAVTPISLFSATRGKAPLN